MRLGVNIISTFLHSLKPRKLLSAPRNAYLPNIFARHNPRLAARAARVRASKIRVGSTASIASTTSTQHRRRRQQQTRSLRRSTTNANVNANGVFPTQVPSFPQPPGAFACAAAPNHIPNADPSTPLGAQKVFFDELYKQRAVLMRAAEERQRQAEEDAEYLRLLVEDERKAQEALRKAQEEEEAERRAEERRVEEELRTKEEKERRRRKKREAEERRQRRAAREERKQEQERLEQERIEQERREQERHRQRREREQQEALRQSQNAASQVTEWLRCYEEKWAVLRADVQLNPLAFYDIPWPLFGIPTTAEDITFVRVQEFLCHPQRESVQSAGLVKSLRSEMLRWHPDKFNAKMLNKVMEGDREAVLEAAGKIARFLTQLTAEIQGRYAT